jgi:PHD/YefM family antitoxin component YafN of YafNO toxin-antitoxin module
VISSSLNQTGAKMTNAKMTITALSSAELRQDTDRIIAEANTEHKVFEVSGPNDQSVVVLSKQDFDGWLETLYLASNPANAAFLSASIAEFDAK